MPKLPSEPKQTNQGAEGRKDEKKGTSPGRTLTDQHTLDQARSPEKKKQPGHKGGNDAHDKR